jgi:hypothetical protein
MDVRTDERAAVRVLLRGLPEASTPTRRIEGYTILVLGDAAAKGWPGIELSVGDLEGITWTTHRQVVSVRRNLEQNPCVVATASVRAVEEG